MSIARLSQCCMVVFVALFVMLAFFSGYYVSNIQSSSVVGMYAGKVYLIEVQRLKEEYSPEKEVDERISALDSYLMFHNESKTVLEEVVGEAAINTDEALAYARLALMYHEKGEVGISHEYADKSMNLFANLGKGFGSYAELLNYIRKIDKKIYEAGGDGGKEKRGASPETIYSQEKGTRGKGTE